MSIPNSQRTPLVVALFFLAAASAVVEGNAQETNVGDAQPLATIRAFIAAFNEHDPEAMKALLAPGAAWHSVAGADLVTEAENRAELIESMKQYFADVPDVHATVEEPVVEGSRVAFRERVIWRNGTRTQTALAVYQVEDGRIARAWYFPAGP